LSIVGARKRQRPNSASQTKAIHHLFCRQGCCRLPLAAAASLADRLGKGMPVLVCLYVKVIRFSAYPNFLAKLLRRGLYNAGKLSLRTREKQGTSP
jgi:hypothetical protein